MKKKTLMLEDVLIYTFDYSCFNNIYISPHKHKLRKLDSEIIEFNWIDRTTKHCCALIY